MSAAYADTHSKLIGYLLWIFGFTGAHRDKISGMH